MNKQNKNSVVETGLDKNKEWSSVKLSNIKNFIKEAAEKRSPERKLKNEMLSIRYQMEELAYTSTDDFKYYPLKTFVDNYLTVMNISFKKFANYLDTTDGNLNKYLTGERKFNSDLAMKFGHFFHTEPEVWIFIEVKNELAHLYKEKESKSYSKYDYLKALELHI